MISFSRTLALALIATSIVMALPAAGVEYARYRNQRFDYSVSYPPRLLFPQGESDNSDGQVFLSRDGLIEMIVSGGWNVFDRTLLEAYQEALWDAKMRSDRTVITYKVVRKNWFVISGVDQRAQLIF
jgi:hypothetical protein